MIKLIKEIFTGNSRLPMQLDTANSKIANLELKLSKHKKDMALERSSHSKTKKGQLSQIKVLTKRLRKSKSKQERLSIELSDIKQKRIRNPKPKLRITNNLLKLTNNL